MLLAAAMLSPALTIQADDAANASNEISGTITQQTDGGSSDANTDTSPSMSDGADEITAADKPFLSLGADLSESQKATVLSLMNVDATQLNQYDVVYTTNAEEHSYLDSYIASSEIGTKSLSSVVIVEKASGSGLTIQTKNISYCTEGMYQNACATAGITDADIIVAGPTSISGTAALVGIFKAYENMTGDEISGDLIDGALNELVVTGQLENSLSSDVDAKDLERMLAAIKQEMVEKGLDSEAGIEDVVDKACNEYGVSLTEDEKDQVVNLMMKLSKLDLNSDVIKKAESMIGQIQLSDESKEGLRSFFAKVIEAIKQLVGKYFG